MVNVFLNIKYKGSFVQSSFKLGIVLYRKAHLVLRIICYNKEQKLLSPAEAVHLGNNLGSLNLVYSKKLHPFIGFLEDTLMLISFFMSISYSSFLWQPFYQLYVKGSIVPPTHMLFCIL